MYELRCLKVVSECFLRAHVRRKRSLSREGVGVKRVRDFEILKIWTLPVPGAHYTHSILKCEYNIPHEKLTPTTCTGRFEICASDQTFYSRSIYRGRQCSLHVLTPGPHAHASTSISFLKNLRPSSLVLNSNKCLSTMSGLLSKDSPHWGIHTI